MVNPRRKRGRSRRPRDRLRWRPCPTPAQSELDRRRALDTAALFRDTKMAGDSSEVILDGRAPSADSDSHQSGE
ncbi:hypothetical protein NDU88_004885 [Pleurodeles waltl]|uniref:Uncharacterized protein n=1 Tax=Pleurodeles waltl TaxID=8319 RepID=A0AAV7PL29_PLEWA|nr:hypothetical protein NDU88_004885 [Pleurodeles waltl]